MSNAQLLIALAERFGLLLLLLCGIAVFLLILWFVISFVAGGWQWRHIKKSLDSLFDADFANMQSALDEIYQDAMRRHPSSQVYDQDEESA